jgi:pectate lyase
MKKIRFPEHMGGGVINADGKYVSVTNNKKQTGKKSSVNSFQDRSNSQNTLSYSTNYLAKN